MAAVTTIFPDARDLALEPFALSGYEALGVASRFGTSTASRLVALASVIAKRRS